MIPYPLITYKSQNEGQSIESNSMSLSGCFQQWLEDISSFEDRRIVSEAHPFRRLCICRKRHIAQRWSLFACLWVFCWKIHRTGQERYYYHHVISQRSCFLKVHNKRVWIRSQILFFWLYHRNAVPLQVVKFFKCYLKNQPAVIFTYQVSRIIAKENLILKNKVWKTMVPGKV